MSVIDLDCIKSEYTMECGCHEVSGSQLLRLGQCNGECFKISLFFHIPHFICSQKIKQARLFLFKIPQETYCNCFENIKNRYFAYPLMEFYGNGCCCEKLQFDKNLYVEFRDKVCASDTEIDITELVEAWVSERIDNKGILLQGCQGDLITYASTRHWDQGMRPFVRITYEESKPLVSVPCTVTVL